MATSALVCINLKTRGKGEDGGGTEESTQQLVQALVDNGIIQLNHKATIRLVDSATTRLVESGARLIDSSTTRLVEGTRLVDSSTTRLVESATARIVEGTAKIGDHELAKPSRPIQLKTTTSGIILEAVEGCDPKVLLGQNHRPILVGRNVLVGGRAAPGVLHLLHEDKLQLLHLAAPSQPEKERTETKVDSATTTTSDGEPIKLPENLESLPKAEHFPVQRHRWNTNEEIAALLITFERHMDWQSKEVKIRPKSGSMLLYSRKKVRYRRDGYCWKKRKDGKTTREDHMKLKVQGTECIYGCYVHSAILPTFHRRCYWLLQNPDIVLVHYLNVPYPDDNKLVSPTLSLCADKKQWTKEELISQLKPMFYSEDEPEFNNELEISTGETVEAIVVELLERQRSARQSALCKQLECGCADSTCADAKTCLQPIRRIQAVKTEPPSDSNQVISTVSSTTGSALSISQRTMLSNQERQIQLHNLQQSQVVTQNGGNSNGPLVLNLSQIQTTGGLLILNSAGQASHQPPQLVHRQMSRLQKDRLQKREPIPMEMESSGSGVHQVRVTRDMGDGREKEAIKFEVKRVQTQIQQTQSQGHQTQMQSQSQQTQATETKQQQVPQLHETKNFYQTLDLSQEDIQQTLSANMPHAHNNRLGTTNTEKTNVLSGLEEIDFIDVSSIQHDDDVLVNLDAFDMLSEFPELDTLDHNHNNNPGGSNNDGRPNDSRESMETEKDNSSNCMGYREGTANITDFSPDWAYTEGGVKVLVTGPWYSTTSPYTVLFDSVPVPTTLVQSGVLRCFCPAHEVGFVSVQVACEGFVISNSVMFEYKVEKDWGGGENARRETDRVRREEDSGMQWPPSESLLRYTLLHRMDVLAQKVDIKQEPIELLERSGGLEDRLVSLVEEMTYRRWKDHETASDWSEKYRGMTLLHLSACLGYIRLICALIQWKTANPNPVLNYEVDGLCQDTDGYTPLMRACGQGKNDTALLLLEWETCAAGLLNKDGKSCIEVASSCGHLALAQQLHSKIELVARPLQISQIQSKKVLVETRSLGTLASHDSLESLNSQNENSIFIHPTQIHRNHSSMELHTSTQIIIDQKNSRHSSPGQTTLSSGLSKRPSVDSGIQLQSSLDNLSSLRTSHTKSNHKLSRFDRSMSLPVSSPGFENGADQVLHSPVRRMDFTLCDVGQSSRSTPSPERRLPDDSQQVVREQDARVLTLAEQIIAAMPERIKVAFFTNESSSECMTIGSDDMEAMSLESPLLLEDQPSSSSSSCLDPPDFSFDHSYRYYDVGTPCSSLSPGSCLASPMTLPRTPSPPPTTADFTEFLHASNSALFEKDFSNLTLSDREQRELYEAAKVIQKAYRSYKGRKKSEQDKERQAAVLIQNCYRRYKQFAYFKQMTRAAMVIQNGYRSYCESKRFKKTQEVMPGRHQNSYTTSTPLKRTYSQRRQNQAARKIQQFMRQSKNKLQRERAERERLDPCKGCHPN